MKACVVGTTNKHGLLRTIDEVNSISSPIFRWWITEVVKILLPLARSQIFSRLCTWLQWWLPSSHRHQRGSFKAIKTILDRCRDSAELVNHSGENAFHLASTLKSEAVLQYLLNRTEFQKLINEPDNEGNTEYADASGHCNPSKWDRGAFVSLRRRGLGNHQQRRLHSYGYLWPP